MTIVKFNMLFARNLKDNLNLRFCVAKLVTHLPSEHQRENLVNKCRDLQESLERQIQNSYQR